MADGAKWQEQSDAIVSLTNSCSIGWDLFGGSIGQIIAKTLRVMLDHEVLLWAQQCKDATKSEISLFENTLMDKARAVKGISHLKDRRQVTICY